MQYPDVESQIFRFRSMISDLMLRDSRVLVETPKLRVSQIAPTKRGDTNMRKMGVWLLQPPFITLYNYTVLISCFHDILSTWISSSRFRVVLIHRRNGVNAFISWLRASERTGLESQRILSIRRYFALFFVPISPQTRVIGYVN